MRAMRPGSLLALMAVLWLLAVPSAQAGWRMDRATAIARIVWHHPCVDRMRLQWVDLPRDIAAQAWPDTCTVDLNAMIPTSWPQFCTRVLHEAGHLAGMGHSTDPRSVMYAEDDRTYGTVLGREAGGDRRCQGRGRPYLERHGLGTAR